MTNDERPRNLFNDSTYCTWVIRICYSFVSGHLTFVISPKENDFGRAVSRILSSPCGGENHLSEQPYPKLVRLREHGAGRSSVSYLALHPTGFSEPPCLRSARWSLTPPFHPYLACAGRSIFCGTIRQNALKHFARVYPACVGYAASCPAVFGLSSSILRRKRSSALPKS